MPTQLDRERALREKQRKQTIKHLRARLKLPGLSAKEARSIMGQIGGLQGAGSSARAAAAKKGGLARAAQRREVR